MKNISFEEKTKQKQMAFKAYTVIRFLANITSRSTDLVDVPVVFQWSKTI